MEAPKGEFTGRKTCNEYSIPASALLSKIITGHVTGIFPGLRDSSSRSYILIASDHRSRRKFCRRHSHRRAPFLSENQRTPSIDNTLTNELAAHVGCLVNGNLKTSFIVKSYHALACQIRRGFPTSPRRSRRHGISGRCISQLPALFRVATTRELVRSKMRFHCTTRAMLGSVSDLFELFGERGLVRRKAL